MSTEAADDGEVPYCERHDMWHYVSDCEEWDAALRRDDELATTRAALAEAEQLAERAEAERDNWEQRALAAEKGNVFQIREMRLRAEQAEAERDLLAAASNRMLDLIDSYPPGSSFARSGAQALFRDALLDQPAKEGGDHHG